MSERDELLSAVGIDYTHLRNLLAVKNWKEADLETSAVMLQAAGREKEGWFSSESIEKFPCADLLTIDRLWAKYSLGRFGFSAQKPIYLEVEQDFEKFGERVGWRVSNYWLNYSELTFDICAPTGHLPSGGIGYQRWTRWIEASYCYLAHRLLSCSESLADSLISNSADCPQ